jgi:hypothetical protein
VPGLRGDLHEGARLGQTEVRDIPAGGDTVEVVVRKRLMVCAEPACGRQTFTQATEQLPARARCLTRLRSSKPRVTNARTEAANTAIKHIKRTGRGYRNHRHYQARILLRSHRQARRQRTRLNQQATTANCG